MWPLINYCHKINSKRNKSRDSRTFNLAMSFLNWTDLLAFLNLIRWFHLWVSVFFQRFSAGVTDSFSLYIELHSASDQHWSWKATCWDRWHLSLWDMEWNDCLWSDFLSGICGLCRWQFALYILSTWEKFTLPKSFNLILVFLWINLLNEQLI